MTRSLRSQQSRQAELVPIVDLFAGPGGWSEGLKALGYRELGIEWDEAACETARAAGHERLQADVAALDPTDYPCWGLIASPPCQAWSMAGKGGGRRDVEHVIACAMEIAAGHDTRAEHAAKCEDARSMLVVEPLRWVRLAEPEWVALEQVPPVLELWTLFAQILEGWGYSTWAGVLEAERYGVPQTRERAVLMASKAKTVHPPIATHQRYVPGQPQRHDITLEGEVLPWVSMAQALGWEEGPSPSPSPSVTGGGGETGGVEVFASKHARHRAAMAINNDRPERKAAGAGNKPRPVDAPAATIDSTTRQAEWITGLDRRQGGAPVRDLDEPAHTMSSQGLAKGRDVWVQRERSGDRAEEGFDPASEPCQTLTSKARSWSVHRPATAICGDPRVFPPGGHMANDGRDNSKMVGRSEGTVRVTIEQASILQSFRPDYPWQGSRSKQFQQIGNAVPPLLARAVLAQLVPATEAEAADAA